MENFTFFVLKKLCKLKIYQVFLMKIFLKKLSNFLKPYADFKAKRVRAALSGDLEKQRTLLGQIRIAQIFDLPPQPLRNSEFSAFSQNGEDGIIQKLIQYLPGIPDTYVEFGVQDYSEANTRFLLLNNNWRGLVMDGSQNNIDTVKKQPLHWMHELQALCAFITVDNINHILQEHGFGELGLLSIDIDGNDYWIWDAIEARPWIVVCEYNSLFGSDATCSIPYKPDFNRTASHYSNIHFGASLHALIHLANKKGYIFVGSDSNGINAFFLRGDITSPFKEVSLEDEYVRTRTRQTRNEAGELTFLLFEPAQRLLEPLPVVDVLTGLEMPFSKHCTNIVHKYPQNSHLYQFE